MNISGRLSYSNFAHHIATHWSLFRVLFESLHNSSHQRETIYDKLIFFAKLVRQWKSKEWAKFGLECLHLKFIYSNSKFKATCETRTLNAGTSGLIPKRNRLKFLTLHSPFCLFIRKEKKPCMAILTTLESTTLDEIIRCASKWFFLTLKHVKSGVG